MFTTTRLVLLLFFVGELLATEYKISMEATNHIQVFGKQFTSDFEISCKASTDTEIEWEVCSSVHHDVYHKKAFMKCGAMVAQPQEYCRKITDTDIFRTIDPDKISHGIIKNITSTLMLKRAPKEPIDGCIRCLIRTNNQTYSDFHKYQFKDLCGRPTHQEAEIRNYSICRTILNDSSHKIKECKNSMPQKVTPVQGLSLAGDLEITLRWQDPEFPSGLYGFNLTVIKHFKASHDGSVDAKQRCFISHLYDHSKTASLNETVIKRYGLVIQKPSCSDCKTRFETKVTDLFPKASSDGNTYEIFLQALPNPDGQNTFALNVTARNQNDLCREFYNKTGFLPSKCYMVSQLSVSPCTEENSTTVSWAIPPGVNWTLLEPYVVISSRFHGDVRIDPRKTSHTFTNVLEPMVFQILLNFTNNTQGFAEIFRIDCRKLVTTVQPPEGGPDNQGILITIIISVVLFLLTVFGVAYCCIRAFKRVSIYESPVTDAEETEQLCVNRTVMLVHPNGCEVLGEIVLLLASEMEQSGFRVVSDIIQLRRNAEIGILQTAEDNFKKADCVVAICTEPPESQYEDHWLYRYVIRQMSEERAIGDTKKHLIAVHFSTKQYVPRYLVLSSYQLPRKYETFFLHLHGYASLPFSSVLVRLFMPKSEQVQHHNNNLKRLVNEFNHDEHGRCSRRFCKKGTLPDYIDSEV